MTETIVQLLNEALATELESVLRLKRRYYCAEPFERWSLRERFLERAVVESIHADRIAERITELGGLPNFAFGFVDAGAESCESPGEMIKEELAAEQHAVARYRRIIGHIGDGDIATRHILETILAEEEEQAHALSHLLDDADVSV